MDVKQITKEQAVKIYDSKIYISWSDDQRVRFQLYQERLAMPFEIFHESVCRVLNRPVSNGEFAFKNALIAEYEGKKGHANYEDILKLLP